MAVSVCPQAVHRLARPRPRTAAGASWPPSPSAGRPDPPAGRRRPTCRSVGSGCRAGPIAHARRRSRRRRPGRRRGGPGRPRRPRPRLWYRPSSAGRRATQVASTRRREDERSARLPRATAVAEAARADTTIATSTSRRPRPFSARGPAPARPSRRNPPRSSGGRRYPPAPMLGPRRRRRCSWPLLAATSLGGWRLGAARPGSGLRDGPARVVTVIDGDTLEVDWAGRRERVRLLGVDTPETVDPDRPVGCYGPEAVGLHPPAPPGAHRPPPLRPPAPRPLRPAAGLPGGRRPPVQRRAPRRRLRPAAW